MTISPSVLELIGSTPMVKTQRLDTGRCELFLKLESANPGGSIKEPAGSSPARRWSKAPPATRGSAWRWSRSRKAIG